MPEIVSTIGTGETFTTLQAWADDIGTNGEGLYTTGDTAVAEVKEDLNVGDADVASFAAANATNPITKAIIRPTSGNAHDGDITAGFHLHTTHFGTEVIEAQSACDYDIDVEDLILKNSSATATSSGNLVVNYSSNAHITIRRCILEGEGGSAAVTGAWSQASNKTIDLIRCTLTGLGIGCRDVHGEISNCTIDDSDTGIDARDSIYTVAENNVVMNCTTCYTGTFATGTDKNMASDATAPGSTVYNNETRADIWTDPDNSDWTLQSGTNAKGTGDNLGTGKEQNIDIENDTVTGDWDLGAYHGAGLLAGVPSTDTVEAIFE